MQSDGLYRNNKTDNDKYVNVNKLQWYIIKYE